jgi:hypothetical protein
MEPRPRRPRRERIDLLLVAARCNVRELRELADATERAADEVEELRRMEWGPSELRRQEQRLEELDLRAANLRTPDPVVVALVLEWPWWRRVWARVRGLTR